MSENLSPNQKAIRRLKKNKPALVGLGIIAFSVILALLGYVIAPDATPNANEQMPIIALKNPGFEVRILMVRKNRDIENRNYINRFFFGAENAYEMIPINEYVITEDSIIFEKYKEIKTGVNATTAHQKDRLHIADVVYQIPYEEAKTLRKQGGFYWIGTQKFDIQKTRQLVENQIKMRSFYLGTDNYGRDNLSRLIIGVRISLLVGLIAVIISLTVGIFFGALAGYLGGHIDNFIMLIINTIWSIPTILLVFAIVLAFGKSIGVIFLAVGLTMWVDVARLVRGQVLSLKEMSFVEAAQSMGFSSFRILTRHILPNILGPVMVVAASNFATAILIESGLSYLGFGIQPPTPSWGTMLNENYGYAIGGKPFLAIVPAVAIMLMVLAFNLVGNGFRDALDVKSKD